MSDLLNEVPAPWRPAVAGAREGLSLAGAWLEAEERAGYAVFPPRGRIFAALEATPPEAVRVVILGQDPYHGRGQAHGLAFSVPDGVPHPPSLRNIFREREADLGLPPPASGDLTGWARQGVLLLNTVLTVREGQAGSHRGRGWEEVTDAVIRFIGHRSVPVVFLLWGAPAQTKARLIDSTRHPVLTASHPSPLSAYRGFLGSRPFSRANDALAAAGRERIAW